ncbi:hypothetical protein J6590_108141, partial [Homalodisca vitripennis]
QNKNAILSNALLHLSMESNVVIEQKWLVKGHTQMECDSVHSKIESLLQPSYNALLHLSMESNVVNRTSG